MFEEQGKNLERLVLKANPVAALPELSGTEIKFIHPKAGFVHGTRGAGHYESTSAVRVYHLDEWLESKKRFPTSYNQPSFQGVSSGDSKVQFRTPAGLLPNTACPTVAS